MRQIGQIWVALLFLLALQLSLPAQQLRTLILHAIDEQMIYNAEVTINGIKATLWNGYGYQIPDSLHAPYTVQARHPDFLPLDCAPQEQLFDPFMFHKGEDSIWSGRCWRPCMHLPGHLLIEGKEYAPNGLRLDPKTVREHMLAVIGRMGYAIVREQKVYGMDNPGPPIKENMYWIKPIKDAAIQDEAAELQGFMADSLVAFAGPAIVFAEQRNAVSFGPQITLTFSQKTDQQASMALLASLGHPIGRPELGNQIWWVTITVDRSNLAQLNHKIRQFSKISGILEISPQLEMWID